MPSTRTSSPYFFIYVPLIKLCRSVEAGVFLSWALQWPEDSCNDGDWYCFTQDECEEETGLSPSTQEKTRRILRALGVLQERRWVLNSIKYRIDKERLATLLDDGPKDLTTVEIYAIYSRNLREISRAALRRAQLAGVTAEYVEYSDLLYGEYLYCSLCGERIGLGPGKNPKNLSFDHIIPIARGGPHIASNIQLSHFGCNAGKRDKIAA